ncbi:MAG: hypothetical protein EBZ49_01070 [Proteobacteria bacterium]|nr:hypothetical protein [Pseudomonadota bacterium]
MQRLTKQWTPTLVEAFGEGVLKARQAEQMVAEAFRKWGYEVFNRESDLQCQKRGIDIEIRKPDWKYFYSIDVKANMDSYGSFYIETLDSGWLFSKSKTSDRICHVCVDSGWIAWYGRSDMIRWLRENNLNNKGLYHMTPRTKLDFITKRKIT